MERGIDSHNVNGNISVKGKGKAQSHIPSRPRKPMSRETTFHKNQARSKAEAQAKLRNAAAQASSSSSSSYATTSVASSSRALESTRKMFDNPHPYRYKSFNDRLASVHIGATSSLTSGRGSTIAGLDVQGVTPAAHSTDLDEDYDEFDDEARMAILLASTAFGSALLTWRELNLTVPFQKLLRILTYKSQSLPQLIHHRSHIVNALSTALRSRAPDAHLAYEPALDLFPRLALDLGTEFLPVYPEALESMLQTTTISRNATGGDEKMAARLVEKAFEMVAALFRNIAPLIVKGEGGQSERDWLKETWSIVRPYLGLFGVSEDAQIRIDQVEASATDPDTVPSAAAMPRQRMPSHVRRFAAEAFAHLLRRAKQPQLVRCADFMLEDVEASLADSSTATGHYDTERPGDGVTSGVAGIWLEVVKSVDRRLHSQAVPQISALLYSTDAPPSRAQTISGKLLFTALVHHGQASHLAPIFVLLITSVDAQLTADEANPTSTTKARLKQSLVWLITALGTRKGNRVDDSVKAPLFALLLRLVQAFANSRDVDRSSILTTLLSVAFPIGRIPDLVGPGIRMVDLLAKEKGDEGDCLSQTFVACVLSLADPALAWTGFKQSVLPQVLTATMQAVSPTSSSSQQAASFQLLNDLAATEHLDRFMQEASNETPNVARWRAVIGTELGPRLNSLAELLSSDADDSDVIRRIEALLPALGLVKLFAQTGYAESIAAPLRTGIESLLAGPFATVSHVGTTDAAPITNPLVLLGSLMSALAQMIAKSSSKVKAQRLLSGLTSNPHLIKAVTQHLPGHTFALSAAVELYEVAQSKSLLPDSDLPVPEDCVESFWPSLMSEDEGLRKASSAWLTLCGQTRKDDKEMSELYDLISKIETIPLRVETVRDRNVRLRSLVRELLRLAAQNEVEGDSKRTAQLQVAAKTICRYVVSTLKLNFKPLWDEARKALADMSGRYAALVWEVSFEELVADRGAKQVPSAGLVEDSVQLPVAYSALQDDLQEDTTDDNDKVFRDPQRTQRMSAILANWQKAAQGVESLTRRELRQRQEPAGRLDVANYQAQILMLFSEQPAMVEKHNAEFVQHFFTTVVEDDAQRRGVDVRDEVEADEEEEEKDTGSWDRKNSAQTILTLKQRQERVRSYLQVFSKFSNPKALFRSADLHNYFYSLLAQGESKIQSLALESVLKWKDSSQVKYEDRLFRLLDQSKFRDELTSFDLSAGGQAIQEEHRAALMPLLIRLLFGAMISKKGRSSASTSGAGKKIAILNALSGCTSTELGILVDLMLGAFEDQKPAIVCGTMTVCETPPAAFLRQQNGFLSLLADVVKHIGAQLLPHWSRLVGVTINLAHHSSMKAVEQGPGRASALSRDVRQAAIRRLADFFRCPISARFDWSAYTRVIFSTLVTPRLELFAVENTQSPSALLELFTAWSNKDEFIPLLVTGDANVLSSLYSCLAVPTVKNLVVVPILDIAERILLCSEEATEEGTEMSKDDTKQARIVKEEVLQPYISPLVRNLGPLVQRTSSAAQPDPLLQREIQLLARIAVFVEHSDDATLVLDLLGPMFRKSSRIVPEKSKTELLSTFRDLLLLTDRFKDPHSEIFARHYELFSSMWSTLRSRPARTSLGTVFKQIALIDGSLGRVAGWVEALNAFSARRLDEVDFDQRLDVFDALAGKDQQLSPREWLPVLHNMLFFIQDGEELVLRSNASAVLRRYVLTVAEETAEEAPLRSLFTRVVYPALRKGLRSRSEPVRREVVSVIGAAVKSLPHLAALSEMQGLLAGGDEEANFFNNIHHIQLHRRSRALRRLADHAESEALKSKTISEVFLPLIAHFLEAGHTEIGDHNLANETLNCIGRLTRQLQWGSYNALLWRYLRLADGKSSGEKIYVRAAMAILDNFHFGMEDIITPEEETNESPDDDGIDGIAENEAAAKMKAEQVNEKEKQVAQSQRIVTSVTAKLLPALMRYLEHHDDETDDALRLPIAVGVVRVVECLPSAEKEVHLAKLLNVLANVFRSKAQDTRDLARETLCKIAVALGAERLPQIVKELRRALTRGPQLAILAYNIHSILVHLMQQAISPLTYLDRGVEEIIAIAGEDLFGHTSEDREAVDYKIKARELRQSKSLDTYEQLSKIIAPHCFSTLLAPLKTVMEQTEVPRSMKAVEDALRRTASGINSNPHFDHQALLGLCHSTVTRNSSFLRARSAAAKGQSSQQPKQDMLLMKRKDVEQGAAIRDHYAANAYRFVAFGLDLLVTALRRSRFDFADKDVLSRLDPLVNAVGNTLYAADTNVVTLGLRATSALLRCPLPSLYASLPVLSRQTIAIINREANPAADASQAGLRALTTMLRECPKAEFKEKQLADLLALTLPEIEEPAAQSSIFGLLRAIIGRRFVVPEVYEAMDKIAEMMVTNQSPQVREISRAAFLQFLLDYPQGKGRLRNQMEFLAKNLSYVYESGRLSVMELLAAVLAKFSDDVLADYSQLLFVALVMVLANDDSSKCREKAAELTKALIALVTEDNRAGLLRMAHSWAEHTERANLSRVGVQVYNLFLEAAPEEAASWTPKAVRVLRDVLINCADDLEELEQADDFAAMDVDLDWQLPYHALQAISKLSRIDSAAPLSGSGKDLWSTWSAIRRLLLFPHAWVRNASCRLIGSLFATTSPIEPLRASASGVMSAKTAGVAVASVAPLSLEALIDTSRKLALQLRGEAVDDALGLQIVKNLLWIGRCFANVKVSETDNRSMRHKKVKGMLAADRSAEVDGEDAEEEDAAEEEEEEDDDDENEGERDEKDFDALANPLAWLYTKLSYQARNVQGGHPTPENPAGLATEGPIAILRWFAAMAQHLSPDRVSLFLPHMITPLFRLMDDETLRGPQVEALKSLAAEVQEVLAERVGTTAYASVYTRVRSRALEKRRQRKTSKLLQGVTDPTGAAKRKEKRNEGKHESRKRKNRVFADGKGRMIGAGNKRGRHGA